MLLDGSRAVREAVNSGEKSLDDIVKLLKHGRRFREWIAGQPADTDLLKQYIRSSTRETWAEQLPTKSVRWMLFTGAGVALDLVGTGGLGTAAGIGLSMVDSFFLDNLTRGWRPSQFVEQRLRTFVDRAK